MWKKQKFIITAVVAFCLMPLSTSMCLAEPSEEGEAIAATMAQLIPKLVDEQIVTINVNGGLNNEGTLLPGLGFEAVYSWHYFLLGGKIVGSRVEDSRIAPSVYGGLLIGQRRFNANVGKFYVDMLLGGGKNNNEEFVWVVEPRFDIVVAQTRKLFIQDIITNNTFGIKLGASVRIAGDKEFNNVVKQSAIMLNLGLFAGKYSD